MDLNMHNDVEFGFMLLFGIPSVRYLGYGTFTSYVFAFVIMECEWVYRIVTDYH